MIRIRVLAAIASSALALPAFAQSSVTVVATEDNTLYEDPTGSLSNGAGNGMFVGVPFSGSIRRALVRFDLRGQVPPGSTVTGARLILVLNRTITGGTTIDAHRVTQAWGEAGSIAGSGGGGGGFAQPGDATWIHTFFPTLSWNTPGGDFAPQASSSAMVGAAAGSYTWASTAALVADVQGWVDDPTTNHGWVLKDRTETLNAAKRFSTREDFVAGNRPRLVIDYRPPQASVTAVGVGCGGTSSLTASATGLPTTGNAAFDVRLVNGVAGNASALYASSGLASTPFQLSTSCRLYLDFALVFLLAGLTLDGAGGTTYPLPIPNDPWLLGAEFALQGVALEPGFELGITTSNALDVRVGA